MAYNICKVCGKFFEKNGQTLCEKCYEKDKREYDRVREFVERHSGATVLDVINSTGISMKTIMRYIEEGSLSYVEDKVKL